MRIARIVQLTLALPLAVNCRSQVHKTDTEAAGQPPQTIAEDTTPDTAGCEILTEILHPDPTALLAEFLRRDSTGDFTSSNAWDASAHMCPGREAGWDGYTIVTGYHLVQLRRSADTSRYEVTYQVYAEAVDDSLHAMNRLRPPEIDTFVVAHTPYGWRIDSPLIPPHISPGATLRIMQIKNSDRAELARLVSER